MDFPCYSGADCFTFNPKKIGYTEKNLLREEAIFFVGNLVRDSVGIVARPSTSAGIVSLAPDVFRNISPSEAKQITLGFQTVARSL